MDIRWTVDADPNTVSRQGVNHPRTKIFLKFPQGIYYVDINLNTFIALTLPKVYIVLLFHCTLYFGSPYVGTLLSSPYGVYHVITY